jgi:hypothetical protein
MATVRRFCTACGAASGGSSLFCERCGSKFPASETGAQRIPTGAVSVPSGPKSRSGWSVVVGDRLPPLATLPLQAAAITSLAPMPLPEKGRVPFSSLRGSALGLFSATALEIAAAIATGAQPTGQLLWIRGGTAAVTLLAGLVAGSSRGLAAIIVAFGSIGVSLLEGHLLWQSVTGLLQVSAAMRDLLPHAVTQGFAVLAGLQIIWRMHK